MSFTAKLDKSLIFEEFDTNLIKFSVSNSKKELLEP
jgi:hypothetical protein